MKVSSHGGHGGCLLGLVRLPVGDLLEHRGGLARRRERERLDAGIRLRRRAVHHLHVHGRGRASLAEFVAARELLERFRDRGLLTRTAAWHVDRLLEGSPWLLRAAPGRPGSDTTWIRASST